MADLDTVGMRERIIETAARLFVAQGYDGISMREIAGACGMSKAGLYYHFKDKEDLFLAILSDHLNELERILREAEGQTGSTRNRITAFVHAIFTKMPLEHRAMIRLASQEISKLKPEQRGEFNRRYQEQFLGRVTGLVMQGIAAGELRQIDPQLGMWSLLGLMYPFFNPGFARNEAEVSQLVAFIVSLFFEGVMQK
jgi:AcrR family transcriptional regulator